jgi:tetratricopeptide (TPR) repeat protein
MASLKSDDPLLRALLTAEEACFDADEQFVGIHSVGGFVRVFVAGAVRQGLAQALLWPLVCAAAVPRRGAPRDDAPRRYVAIRAALGLCRHCNVDDDVVQELRWWLAELAQDLLGFQSARRFVDLWLHHLDDDSCRDVERLQQCARWARRRGDGASAVWLLERGLGHMLRHHGREHLWTSIYLTDLGGALCDVGRFRAAEDAYAQSLAIATNVLDEDAEQVLVTLANIGHLYARTERPGLARALWEDLLPRRARTHGHLSEAVVSTHEALGDICITLHDDHAAEEHLRAAVDIARAMQWRYFVPTFALVELLEQQGRTEEAERIMQETAAFGC